MNKKLITLLLVIVNFSSSAQDLKDFFKADTKVNWLGVDFSHSKIIGEFSQFMGAGKKGADDIQMVYMPAWNRLFINEMEKYDLRKYLNKNNVFIDIDSVNAANARVASQSLEGYNHPNYPKDSISLFIKESSYPVRKELGVLLLTDYLNKGLKEAGFHFVVFDMSTREVLLTELIKTEPGGFGIRNYWASAILDALKVVEKKKYKKWAKSYR